MGPSIIRNSLIRNSTHNVYDYVSNFQMSNCVQFNYSFEILYNCNHIKLLLAIHPSQPTTPSQPFLVGNTVPNSSKLF